MTFYIDVSVLSLEFVLGLAQFNSRDDEERRLQFIFRIYDMDRDGYISNGELFQVCHAISRLKSEKNTIARDIAGLLKFFPKMLISA